MIIQAMDNNPPGMETAVAIPFMLGAKVTKTI